MSLLRRTEPRRLRPAWEYASPGVLWRVQPATPTLLMAEERNVEKKQAVFLALDARTGSPSWKRTFGDPWWVGVEAVQEGVMLLHGFTTPDLPEHKGVTAVDVASGEVLWEHHDARYRLTIGATALLSDMGGRFIEVNLRTGSIVHDHGSDLHALGDARQRAAERVSAGGVEGADYPLPLEYLTEQDAGLSGVLRPLFSGMPLPAAEAINAGGVIVCAYRAAAGAETLAAVTLAVVERSGGKVLFNDRLSTSYGMPVADAFFTLGRMLYYVKEQRHLIALPLELPSHS